MQGETRLYACKRTWQLIAKLGNKLEQGLWLLSSVFSLELGVRVGRKSADKCTV
jgi:hypothetical protein